MSTNPKQPTQRYEIKGVGFNQGVLAALRAYPNVLSVTRSTSGEVEGLILEALISDNALDINRFTDTIIRAGGEVVAVRLLDHHNDESEAGCG